MFPPQSSSIQILNSNYIFAAYQFAEKPLFEPLNYQRFQSLCIYQTRVVLPAIFLVFEYLEVSSKFDRVNLGYHQVDVACRSSCSVEILTQVIY